MRRALILFHGKPAAILIEEERNARYELTYLPDYTDVPVSLTLPIRPEPYQFDQFPPFFDGLLPEGVMLDALLRTAKIDRDDPFSQLLAVGEDLVGAVTVERYPTAETAPGDES